MGLAVTGRVVREAAKSRYDFRLKEMKLMMGNASDARASRDAIMCGGGMVHM